MPRYANSDLGEYRDTLFSNQVKKPLATALMFGTLFHSVVLECAQPSNISPKMAKQLGSMREAVMCNKFARQVLLTAEVEQVNTWIDKQTGLPCKSKTDIWVPENELIADLKTTSATSYGEFLNSCAQYAYDRQAAFYLDGKPEAKRFVILGVQKQEPFDVFYFEASACRGCIDGGRKKYQTLLRDIKRSGFTPSSWGPTSRAKIVEVSDECRSGQLVAV